PAQYVVPRDAQQEGVDRPSSLVIITRFTHQHHKNFLGDILGHFSRATHLQGEAINIRLPTTVELGKRFPVAAKHQLQEIAVRVLNRLHQNLELLYSRCIHPTNRKGSKRFVGNRLAESDELPKTAAA